MIDSCCLKVELLVVILWFVLQESEDTLKKQGQLLRRLLMAESISDDKTDELSR